jgi:hypothetical protein
MVNVSAVLRLAAQLYANKYTHASRQGCCYAIHCAGRRLRRYHGAEDAEDYFDKLFNDGASRHYPYFWANPQHQDSGAFERARPLRVLALLLAADVAESEGR